MNIQLTDMAVAKDVAELGGKQDYLPGDAGALRYDAFLWTPPRKQAPLRFGAGH